MLNKAWFILRLLIFIFTIRYAIAFTRCLAEFAWIFQPHHITSATYQWRLQTLEPENVRELHVAVKGLFAKYEQASILGLERLAVKEKQWMESVDKALKKETFGSDEAAKEEFEAAYRAYVDLMAKIVEEVKEAENVLRISREYRRRNSEYPKDQERKKYFEVLSDNRERHHLAVKELLGAIPYRYLSTLEVWQESGRKGGRSGDRYMNYRDNPCEKVWAKRYGDEKFARALNAVVQPVIFVWLCSVVLRFLELVLNGTHGVAWLQGWVLGLLWSVYYDAPRHALLWLLRKIDTKLDSTILKPDKDSDSQQRLFVVEELKVGRRS